MGAEVGARARVRAGRRRPATGRARSSRRTRRRCRGRRRRARPSRRRGRTRAGRRRRARRSASGRRSSARGPAGRAPRRSRAPAAGRWSTTVSAREERGGAVDPGDRGREQAARAAGRARARDGGVAESPAHLVVREVDGRAGRVEHDAVRGATRRSATRRRRAGSSAASAPCGASCSRGQPEEEVDAVRCADLLLVVLVQRAARDAEDELRGEVADRDRRGSRTRCPATRTGGSRRAAPPPRGGRAAPPPSAPASPAAAPPGATAAGAR